MKQQSLQNWATPPDFFKFLDDRFHFDIDVCASVDNAKCRRFIDEKMNGLVTPWFTGRPSVSAFCNPGFSKPDAWHHRAFAECQGRSSCLPERPRFAVVLGIAGASQEWYEFAYDHTLMILNLSPRVQYIDPTGAGRENNNYESAVYVYSSLPPCPGNILRVQWKPRKQKKARA